MSEKIILLSLVVVAGIGVYTLYKNDDFVPISHHPIAPKKIRPGSQLPVYEQSPLFTDKNLKISNDDALEMMKRDIFKHGLYH